MSFSSLIYFRQFCLFFPSILPSVGISWLVFCRFPLYHLLVFSLYNILLLNMFVLFYFTYPWSSTSCLRLTSTFQPSFSVIFFNTIISMVPKYPMSSWRTRSYFWSVVIVGLNTVFYYYKFCFLYNTLVLPLSLIHI